VGLQQAIERWGKSFGLVDAWTHEQALTTLSVWHANPVEDPATEIGWGDFPAGGGGFPVVRPHKFVARLPSWDPERESRSDYQARIRKTFRQRFNQQLKRYCDGIEELMAAAGRQTELPKRKLRQHLEWLVRWQVRRETYVTVAGHHHEVSAVRKGIQDVARLCGLTPRTRVPR
jgi:hypothetical protein